MLVMKKRRIMRLNDWDWSLEGDNIHQSSEVDAGKYLAQVKAAWEVRGSESESWPACRARGEATSERKVRAESCHENLLHSRIS